MKTKFYLDKRKPARVLTPDTGGVEPEYPVKIAINSKGRSAYIGTGISVKETEWAGMPKPGRVVGHPRAAALNLKLTELKLSVDKILEHLRESGELHGKTASEIKALAGKRLAYDKYGESDAECPVIMCFDSFLASKKRKKGTLGVYESTRRRLLAYGKFSDKTTFRDITPGWLTEFDEWLGETAPSANARGIHLRNIRAIFNYAESEKLTLAVYPFLRYKIKTQPTDDRSLTPEELRAIRDARCSPSLAKYRDIFLLSFCLCGMNIEDILNLKDVKGGRVEIRRIKTGQPLSMKVQPEAWDIINRYRGNGYLLDVLDRCHNYENYQSRMNRALKRVGQEYNPKTKQWEGEPIVPGLSFYYARYAWATIAAELDIPERTIGAAMAHGTARTVTSIYTRVDMRKKVDAANRAVLDYCFPHEEEYLEE